jgi:hypothetical protein
MRGKLIGGKHFVHNRRSIHIRHKVRLELVEINVEGAIEAKRCRDGRDNLGDETIQVGEAWRSNVQAVLANVVDRFVINLHGQKISNNKDAYTVETLP